MKQPAAITATLEAAVNRYLALDPAAGARLGELEGRIIALELRGLDTTICLRVHATGISVLETADTAPDTIIRGTPFGMLRLVLGSNAASTLFSGTVEIEGDVDTGQAFKSLLDDMDIDWEEQLSILTGDIIAHQLGNMARTAGGWLRHVRTTLEQDLSEYLQEELRVVPTRIEIDNFIAEVDRLGMDLDRIAARIRRLQSRGSLP